MTTAILRNLVEAFKIYVNTAKYSINLKDGYSVVAILLEHPHFECLKQTYTPNNPECLDSYFGAGAFNSLFSPKNYSPIDRYLERGTAHYFFNPLHFQRRLDREILIDRLTCSISSLRSTLGESIFQDCLL